MSYKEKDIVHEGKNHWVLRVKPGYFEVYKRGITHSVRCDIIQFSNDESKALTRAIELCNRRDLSTQ